MNTMNTMKMFGKFMGRPEAENWMEFDMEHEDALLIMESFQENPNEKLVDSDFFNKFDDDFDDDDLD
jgi:hypothetical protein